MFTRSKNGSKQGQMQDLERENRPALPTPPWVSAIQQEIRAIGDVVRLREALAVSHRDIERFRVERDRLIKDLVREREKVRDLEEVIRKQMRITT